MNNESWSHRPADPVRAASMKEFGCRQPIVVNKHGVIVAGHTRLAAAKQLGLEHVLVHLAGDPSAVLSMEMGELKGLGFDMAMTGFTIGALNNLVPVAAGLTKDDAVPTPPDTPVTVLGDCWLLGPPRRTPVEATACSARARA